MIVKVIDAQHSYAYINLDYVIGMSATNDRVYVKLAGVDKRVWYHIDCDGKNILELWLDYKGLLNK